MNCPTKFQFDQINFGSLNVALNTDFCNNHCDLLHEDFSRYHNYFKRSVSLSLHIWSNCHIIACFCLLTKTISLLSSFWSQQHRHKLSTGFVDQTIIPYCKNLWFQWAHLSFLPLQGPESRATRCWYVPPLTNHTSLWNGRTMNLY